LGNSLASGRFTLIGHRSTAYAYRRLSMCILLVEDEPLIRAIVADELAFQGFEVCEAETGDVAATLIENPPTAFSLLITDIHMPGQLNGIGVARLMRRRYPSVSIIYTSGRPDVLHALKPLGPKEALVAKPFTLSELMPIVRQLLDSP
jgi:DNA-binding response OmpR family regulator